MNIIGFPNLGIDAVKINPTAFSIGGFTVQWYGLIIVVGMILATLYSYYRMKGEGYTLDNTLDLAIVCIPVGIIGARAFYVLTSLDKYSSFYDVIAIWNGGLAIYGGIIGGIIGIYIVCKVKKYKFFQILDCIAPGVLIGQLLGRWGNFTNAEAYGVIGNYDFLGASFDASGLAGSNPFIMTINGMYVHPTFLYESVWNLAGFIILNLFWKRRKYNGQITLMYLAWYGLGRCIIEGFRGDSLYIGSIRISQLIAFVCFIAGTALLIALGIKNRKKKDEKNAA